MLNESKVVKSATKKQVNESAVQNAVTVAMEDQTSKFDFSNIAKLILDLQDVLKENKQLNAIKEENKALKAEMRTLKKEFHEHVNKMRENQLNLCLALARQAPQEYFMTVSCHDQAMALDAVADEHGLYMFCLERVDSGKGLESEFRVGFKVQTGNTTPAGSMKNFIASFKEVK
jgi:rhamnogalacturonyl hydrolase YesR